MSTDVQCVESYRKLLDEYQRLPEIKTSRTIMEVSGYPHYENVSSNILAFYFDPAAEHGLKDLLLRAFSQMTDVEGELSSDNVTVERELYIDGRKRIDLTITGEDFVIGIENKIYDRLGNDLDAYGKTIDRIGIDKSIVRKAVLALRPIGDTTSIGGGFEVYTYSQLWEQVQGLLGRYLSQADHKWIVYLVDFMQTTTNLGGQNMELREQDEFFIENDQVIQKMLEDRKHFLARLRAKVEELCNLLKNSETDEGLHQQPWVYNNSCVVLDFPFPDEYKIAIDLYLRPSGWELSMIGRGAKSLNYLHDLNKQHPLQVKNCEFCEGRYIAGKWPIKTDLPILKDALLELKRALLEAAKGIPN